MQSALFELISRTRPLSPELMQELTGLLVRRQLPAKTQLLTIGDICSELYFIESGLARAYYFRGADDITAWFMPENNLILSVRSFFLQVPSYEHIELLEDSQILSIRYNDLQHLYRKYEEFNYVGRVLTERYYVLSEERTLSLRRKTGKERLEALLAGFPQLFNRVPLRHIASYLGMAPETLSRLRRRLK
jgi:CRP-like cAMP-binding protein